MKNPTLYAVEWRSPFSTRKGWERLGKRDGVTGPLDLHTARMMASAWIDADANPALDVVAVRLVPLNGEPKTPPPPMPTPSVEILTRRLHRLEDAAREVIRMEHERQPEPHRTEALADLETVLEEQEQDA